MDKNSLEDIKRAYKEYYDSLTEIDKLEEAKKAYELHPLIKEYVKLTEKLNTDKTIVSRYGEGTESEIINRIVDGIGISPKGNVYFWLQTDMNFNSYANLDSGATIQKGNFLSIPIDAVKEFEENNIVLYPPSNVDSVEYFNKMKYLYFRMALESGLDKANEFIRNLKENNEQELKR